MNKLVVVFMCKDCQTFKAKINWLGLCRECQQYVKDDFLYWNDYDYDESDAPKTQKA